MTTVKIANAYEWALDRFRRGVPVVWCARNRKTERLANREIRRASVHHFLESSK